MAAIALVPVATFAAAFAAGRASTGHRVGAAAIQIRAGLPAGVLHTPPGALAAADNYVAAGMTASLDQPRLQQFADALVLPAARRGLLHVSAQLERRSAPPGENVRHHHLGRARAPGLRSGHGPGDDVGGRELLGAEPRAHPVLGPGGPGAALERRALVDSVAGRAGSRSGARSHRRPPRRDHERGVGPRARRDERALLRGRLQMTPIRARRSMPPVGPGRGLARAGLVSVTALAALGGVLAGRAGSTPPGAPIEFARGVPVGVADTPAGAVAAADEYLATEQQTVGDEPGRFGALVAADYAAPIKAGALAAGERDRHGDSVGIPDRAGGARSFTVIGADRLDAYGGGVATVSTWAGQIYWGPGRTPAQVWALGQTTLCVGGRAVAGDPHEDPGPARTRARRHASGRSR